MATIPLSVSRNKRRELLKKARQQGRNYAPRIVAENGYSGMSNTSQAGD